MLGVSQLWMGELEYDLSFPELGRFEREGCATFKDLAFSPILKVCYGAEYLLINKDL
jgi:hypothetical protein